MHIVDRQSGERFAVVFVLVAPVPVFLLLVFVTLLQILIVPAGLPFPLAVVDHLSGDRMTILIIQIVVPRMYCATVVIATTDIAAANEHEQPIFLKHIVFLWHALEGQTPHCPINADLRARVAYHTEEEIKEEYPVKADGGHKGAIPHYNLSDREPRGLRKLATMPNIHAPA